MQSLGPKLPAILGLFALSTCSLPNAARAQDGLQVADAANVVLGPIVGIELGASPHSPRYYFAYRQGGSSVLLALDSAARVSHTATGSLTFRFYYVSEDCSGTPVVATGGECCATRLTPKIIPDGLGQLWMIDETHFITPTTGSRRPVGHSDDDLGDCETLIPVPTQGFEISLWGTLTFTPPLRIEANPFIFGDDFSSTNMEAWSNH